MPNIGLNWQCLTKELNLKTFLIPWSWTGLTAPSLTEVFFFILRLQPKVYYS